MSKLCDGIETIKQYCGDYFKSAIVGNKCLLWTSSPAISANIDYIILLLRPYEISIGWRRSGCDELISGESAIELDDPAGPKLVQKKLKELFKKMEKLYKEKK